MKKKFFSFLTAFTVAVNLVPFAAFTAFAASGHDNKVHVIVENTTFTPGSENWNDSFWHGSLVDTWVSLNSDSTAVNCIVKALDEKGYTQTGAENNYIDSVNGLKAYDGGTMSGWMGTINDWFANEGFDAFTAANGKLTEGDEIRLMYTCNWGEDLGSSWSSSDTTLNSVKFSGGTLSPEFDKDTHEYVLNVPADLEYIKITPTASNKNYQVRTRIGDTVYKRSADIPVENGADIIIECNYEGSVSMNTEGEAQTYTFNVKKDAPSAPKNDYAEILSASMAKLAVAVPAPEFGASAGEWSVIGLARGGYFSKDSAYFKDYYDRIVNTVNETAASVNMNGALHSSRSTDNSRLIIALASIGKSAKSVGEWDITAPFEDMEWIKKQGINGPVWALIALDTKNYKTKDTTIHQQCINNILSNQTESGGWSFGGNTADPDLTGMVLQALSRYTEDGKVKEAVDKAVSVLSSMQTETGGYSSWGSENSESAAQVITALTSLGIDPGTDKRFVKNGNSVVDALLSFYDSKTQDFKHVSDGEGNGMATDQAVYALVSYDRFVKGKTSLYDMSDVGSETVPTTTPDPAVTTAASSAATVTTVSNLTTVSTSSSVTTATSVTETSTTVTGGTDLPQTGNNAPLTAAIFGGAVILAAAGAYMITVSKNKKNSE